jgi:glycolate oxidase FAD binding subunit
MIEASRPETEDQLTEAVADALAATRPLAVSGRGTKSGLGCPARAEAALSTTGLAGIIYYEPGELVMEALAGTPLAEVEAALAENNQRLAFEPPDLGPLYGGEAGMGTIGGVFGCNLSGPRRPFAGAARDHLLGICAVSGRGECFASGGRVVKNVTGYDMSKLMTGSMGTLAVLSRVTFKVLPTPPSARTILIFGEDEGPATQAIVRALEGPWEVNGAAWLPDTAAARSTVGYVRDGGAAMTALRLEGARGAVADRAQSLRAALADLGPTEELHTTNTETFWRELKNGALLSPDEGAGALWRLVLPPASAPSVLAMIGDQLKAEGVMDWGSGLVWLALAPGAWAADDAGGAAIVRGAAELAGGHGTLYRASGELRSHIPVFHPEAPPLAALSRRVKENFDPAGILNPGRMVEGL